jgi:uncharacterized protein (DUF433 family)
MGCSLCGCIVKFKNTLDSPYKATYWPRVMQKKTSAVPAAVRKQLAKEYRNSATLTELSVNHKIGLPQVRQALVEEGVQIRKKGGSLPFDPNRADEMTKLYLDDGRTLQEIGDQFGLSRERVRQILRGNGVESLGRRERPRKEPPLTAREKKIAAAYDRGVRPSDLKERYPGLTYSALQSILKRAGIETKPKGFFNRRSGYEKTVTGIIKDYLRGDDTGDIADRYKLCGRTEIYKFLKREGIPVRHQHQSSEAEPQAMHA